MAVGFEKMLFSFFVFLLIDAIKQLVRLRRSIFFVKAGYAEHNAYPCKAKTSECKRQRHGDYGIFGTRHYFTPNNSGLRHVSYRRK